MEANVLVTLVIGLLLNVTICSVRCEHEGRRDVYQVRDVLDYTEPAAEASTDDVSTPIIDDDDDDDGFLRRPGFVGRITQKGFNFAASLAIRMLMKQLTRVEIPDMKSSFGMTDVTMSNIKMEKFPKPSSRLYPIPWPGYGMRWHAYNINPIITANYKAKIGFAFWKITKEGVATFTGEDMFFALDFLISRDASGHPTTEVLNCKSEGSVKLKFTGQWSDILNVGSTMFAKKIRSLITAQMCHQAKTEISTRLAAKLRGVPLQHLVADQYLLDLSVLEPPTFQDDAVDVLFKGVVYDRDNPEDPPFYPPEIGNHDDDDNRMIYLYVTDYLINSAFYATFRRGMMNYNITPEIVPEEFRGYLNTTCMGDICIGTIFPQLSWLYPESSITVALLATSAPRMSIAGNSFNVTAGGEAEVFVQHRNGSKHNLFIVDVDISGGFSLEIIGKKLYFNVSFIDPHAEVKESFIGDIGTGFLFESVLRLATQKVLLPRISENGAKGLSLPKVKGLEFLNPIIVEHEMQNVFVVATDIGFEVKKKRILIKRRRRQQLRDPQRARTLRARV
ncbi:hypothetical protein LSH36_35g01053 [Paralvinella palmiformis]|uniref:Uncharacterized protein n=1 Tax=Paralvinella palmiformis TaxID=53620 RepID=A0AAD9K8R4_9ANNE|nr:hypothetical protein LSH36_35g01053 [Paralvinella palmiformis]